MVNLNKFTCYVSAVIFILVLSGFVATQDRALSPTETAKQLFAAVEKKDTEAFKALLCKNVRNYLEKSERKDDMLQVFMNAVGMGMPEKDSSPSEKIDGNSAKVTFTKKSPDGSSSESSIELSKEGDRWTGFCLDAKGLEGFELSDKMASQMASAKPVEDPQIRTGVEDFYAKRDQAFKAKDFASFKSMETDDYKTVVWFFLPNVSNRQEADDNTANLLQGYKVVRAISTKLDNLKRGADENEVIVQTTHTVRWTDPGGNNNSLDAKYHETLVRTKDGWKVKYSEVVEFSQKAQ